MEKDDELKGEGNSYYTHFRLLDPRIGRWMSIDPEAKEYPDESPYTAMENNPMTETDPDGDCPWCIAFVKGAVQEYATQVITNIAEGKDWKRSLTEVDGMEIVKAGAIDAVTLGLGSLVKKGTAALRIAHAASNAKKIEKAAVVALKIEKTGEKLAKAEKNIVKAEKALVKAEKSLVKGEEAIAKKLNKNANEYVGDQAVYEIKKDGKLLKYGKADATNLNKATGNPNRLQTQLRRLEKAHPNSTIEGKVLETHPNISTKDIKKIETDYIQKFTDKAGKLPDGNQGHPGIKL